MVNLFSEQHLGALHNVFKSKGISNLFNMTVYSNEYCSLIWKSYNRGEDKTPMARSTLDKNFEAWEVFKQDKYDFDTPNQSFFCLHS